MSEKKLLHAWFSQDMLLVGGSGTCFYKRIDGSEVEVTCVATTMAHSCTWNDMIYLGEVIDGSFRDGQPATEGIMPALLGLLDNPGLLN
jgi:hypothetical protein